MENKFIWFLIFFIIGLAVVWLVGAFVAWNLLWFLSGVVGRVMGILCFLAVLSTAIDESSDM